jgi:predicted RNA-binding protein (virulence factor B family)
MAEIGSFNSLAVTRLTAHGALLDDGDGDEILLPNRYVPKDCAVGTVLDVFLYFDSEDRLTATTLAPLAQIGEVAYLEIVSLNDAGVFLDWGLPKDLLLPYNEVSREQKFHLEEGRRILVMVFEDEQGRIAASARLDDFLASEAGGFNEGDKVSVIIADRTDLGVRVVVNNRYWGLVHSSELFRQVHKGEKTDGYIKALRSDRKLNISLTAPGHGKVDKVAQDILDTLVGHGGFMAVSDKSPPEAIYKLFGVSKKVFKQAIGALYKQQYIVIETAGIRATEKAGK